MIDHDGAIIRLKFNRSCLKQSNNLTYYYGHKVNVYIVSELGVSSSNDSDSTRKNCLFGVIFGVDMSSSAHIDNKKKDLLVLGKGPTQGLEHTLTAEKMYSISFNVTNKKFCWTLHYNGANSYLFINGTEIYKCKAKNSEIFVGPICLVWF